MSKSGSGGEASFSGDGRDIEAVLAGDVDAYENLVRRYEKKIAALMWRFSRDVSVRDELVQDVFVEAYLCLEKYGGAGPFLHWLRAIAARVGYRYWKGQEKQRGDVQIEAGPALFAAPDEAPAAARAALLLQALLARLNVEDRLVLTLMYFDGCSTREVSERTGWNRIVVATRAYRARHRLRELIKKENLLGELRWLK